MIHIEGVSEQIHDLQIFTRQKAQEMSQQATISKMERFTELFPHVIESINDAITQGTQKFGHNFETTWVYHITEADINKGLNASWIDFLINQVLTEYGTMTSLNTSSMLVLRRISIVLNWEYATLYPPADGGEEENEDGES